jgi:hypothetical protein
MSPEQITAHYRKRIGSDEREPTADPRILGHFERLPGRRGIIYVLDPKLAPGADRHETPLHNPIFRERLLHELMHYAQHYTGAYEKFKCEAKAEFDAYLPGGKYLAQRGASEDYEMRIRRAWAFSQCRRRAVRQAGA